jgi:hypothetical protein
MPEGAQVGDLRTQRYDGEHWSTIDLLTGDALIDAVQEFFVANWYGYIDISVGQSANVDDRYELRKLIRVILNGLDQWSHEGGWQASKSEVQRLVGEIERLRRELTVRGGPYRVGRKLGRTIYNDDEILIGVMDTPELGALVVDALNRCHPTPPETPENSPQSAPVAVEAQEDPGTGERHTDAVWVRSACGHEVRVWLHDGLSPPAVGQYGWCPCEDRICRAVSIELVDT